MSDLIAEHGYLAVLVGCFLEGETVLVLGALAAKLGFLDIGLVILCGLTGTFCGDNLFFFLGRLYGDKPLRRRAQWRLRARVVKKLLNQYDTWFILGFRFIYGVRSICPFVFGMSGVPPRRFMALDLAAGAVWAAAIGGATFALGSVVELFLIRVKGYEVIVLGAVAATGLALWTLYLLRMRMRTRRFVEVEAAKNNNGNGNARAAGK